MTIPVFILSWERPLYLWVTLDSLHRHTRHPVRFILVDNASRDPLVAEIVSGFERRGMFSDVFRCETNSLQNFPRIAEGMFDRLPDVFGYVEGDVEVLPSDPDWLTIMAGLMDRHPDLAYLGSLIDSGDFAAESEALRLAPGLDETHRRQLVKFYSPERSYPQDAQQPELRTDLAPPGRMCLYRKEALRSVPFMDDAGFTNAVRAEGWTTGIAMRARHRHLSLLHIYDYPDYDVEGRAAFFALPKPGG